MKSLLAVLAMSLALASTSSADVTYNATGLLDFTPCNNSSCAVTATGQVVRINEQNEPRVSGKILSLGTNSAPHYPCTVTGQNVKIWVTALDGSFGGYRFLCNDATVTVYAVSGFACVDSVVATGSESGMPFVARLYDPSLNGEGHSIYHFLLIRPGMNEPNPIEP